MIQAKELSVFYSHFFRCVGPFVLLFGARGLLMKPNGECRSRVAYPTQRTNSFFCAFFDFERTLSARLEDNAEPGLTLKLRQSQSQRTTHTSHFLSAFRHLSCSFVAKAPTVTVRKSPNFSVHSELSMNIRPNVTFGQNL